MSIIWRIFQNKWYPPADPTTLSFKGKTVIVTGSNIGLGYHAAVKFAQQGAHRLILGVRDKEKGERAQRVIQHLALDSACKVEVWPLDMLSYDSVTAFANRVRDELETLHIAVLNAGVYSVDYKQSSYGWEHTLQINTLSTTLLALMLLPKMREARTADFTPVLELTSSGRHRAATITDEQQSPDANILEEFNEKDNFASGKLYAASKLFLMYALQELSQLAKDPSGERIDVFVTSVCPGACQSDLSRGLVGVSMRIARYYANMLFLRTTEEGSRTLVSGTSTGEKGHGGFWQNDIIREPAPLLSGDEGKKLQDKVWHEILDALRKDVPEVLQYSLAQP